MDASDAREENHPNLGRLDLALAAAPLAVGVVWLPLFEGGSNTKQLLAVQAVSFGALAVLGVRGRLARGLGDSRLVLFTLSFICGAAILSTAGSKDLEASVPLAVLWLWLGACGFLLALAAHHPRAGGVIHTALITAAIAQAAWGFFVWWGGGERAETQSGTFYAPNQYAGFLLLLAPLLLANALTRTNRREAFHWGVFTTLVYLGVAFSGSRGGSVAALVGGAACVTILAVRATAPRRELIVRAAAIAVMFVAASFFLTSRLLFPLENAGGTPLGGGALTSFSEKSLPASLAMRARWSQGSILIWLSRPLTGTGLGTFGDMFASVQDPAWRWSRYAHNHYLEALAEGGLPLAAGVVSLPVVALTAGLRRRATTPAEEARQAGLAAGILGGSLHLVIDHDWSYPAYALVFVLMCVLVSASGRAQTRSRAFSRGASSVVALLAALCLLAVGSQVAAGRLRSASEGAPGAALTSLETASRLAPWLTWPLRGQATLLASLEPPDLERAVDLERRAAAIDRLEPRILWELAVLYERLGSIDQARRAFDSAIEVAPNAPPSYRLAAEFELRLGEAARAAGLLDRGVDRLLARPDPGRLALQISDLLMLRARAEEQIQSAQAALVFAARAVELSPRNGRAWLELARLACGSGNPARAEDAARQAERLRALPADIASLRSHLAEGCP